MSSASRTIARIVGPPVVALAVTEWINMDIFAQQTAPVVYLNGTLLLVGGVAILQAHNRWSPGWPLLVTLTGWITAALGLLRMIAPQATQAQEGPTINLVFIALAILGGALSIRGYLLQDDA
ncbi:hypothetical protein [Phenylobacterium sp.]|uniref:hypothetical protein n=1 Tax=Phenylobacterium sp. TaxID=1871053 RepID=UPI00286C9765|nr:hypothetical protein [Phenylobacterium sp.]